MPNRPTTDVVRMIFPCRCATMCGQAAFTVLTGAPRCTRQYRSKSSRVASSNSWLPQIPALFTRRSILPKCSMVVATRSLPPSGVETSLLFAIASPPRDRMRSATCPAIVASFPNPDTSVPRSFTTSRAPRSARSSTYARPSPRPAPVTTATFPSNEIRSGISLSSCVKIQCCSPHDTPPHPFMPSPTFEYSSSPNGLSLSPVLGPFLADAMRQGPFVREKFTLGAHGRQEVGRGIFPALSKGAVPDRSRELAPSATAKHRIHDEAAARADRGGG